MNGPSESNSALATMAGIEQSLDRGATEIALGELASLCLATDPVLEGEALNAIEERLQRAGVLADAASMLCGALSQPGCQVEAGRLWARLCWRGRNCEASKELRVLVRSGPAGEEATVEWARLLTEHGCDAELMRLAILTELYLLSSSRAWCAVAAGLRERRLYHIARFWVTHWSEVPALDAGQLLIVAELFRGAGWSDRGAAINRDAVQRFPTSREAARHRCWLAVDSVTRGEFAQAAEQLGQTQPAATRIDDRMLETLVTSSVAVAATTAEGRPQVLADARQSIDEVVAAYPELGREPARLEFYNHVLRYLADKDGLGTRLWAWWRRRDGE